MKKIRKSNLIPLITLVVCSGLLYILSAGCTGQLTEGTFPTSENAQTFGNAITGEAPLTQAPQLGGEGAVVDPKLEKQFSCPASEKPLVDGFKKMVGVNCASFTAVDVQQVYENSLNMPQLFQATSNEFAKKISTPREYDSLKEAMVNLSGDFLAQSTALYACEEAPAADTRQREVAIDSTLGQEADATAPETPSSTDFQINLNRYAQLRDVVRIETTRLPADVLGSAMESTATDLTESRSILYILKARESFKKMFTDPAYAEDKAALSIAARFDGTYQDIGANRGFIGTDDMIIFGYAPIVQLQASSRSSVNNFSEMDWAAVPKSTIRNLKVERPAETTPVKTTEVPLSITVNKILNADGINLQADDICEERKVILNDNLGSFEQTASIRKFTSDQIGTLLEQMALVKPPEETTQTEVAAPAEAAEAPSSNELIAPPPTDSRARVYMESIANPPLLDALKAVDLALTSDACLAILEDYKPTLTDEEILTVQNKCETMP